MRQLLKAVSTFLLLAAGSAGAQDADLPEYIGSQTCAGCHEAETEAWSGSHHALAWTAPTAENVVADFNGTEFAHDGTLTRFRIEDGTYYAEVTEKDGSVRDYPVHSVAGIEPLQQYLLETEPGKLQSFDVVWDTEQKRWYHLYPDQDLPPNDGLHWSGPYKNWNARCAECHATGFEKNYDSATRAYQSTQSEIGVGCEACHGPGSAHVDWANGLEIAGSGADLDAYGFTMTFGQSVEADIQQCAGCHARREAFGQGNPLPGTPFADSYGLALLRPGLYHADGQILDEVYVYGSFLQSKMYAKGVGCSNCHDAHTAERIAEGNAVCTQCHSTAGNPDFPSLRLADYDTPEHHFHEAGSDGAQCKSCHMIERDYMGVDGRRDHSFRVPRPDLAAETGSPDACTDCHTDQSPDWAAERIADWYPDSAHRGFHYGQVLARGRADAVSASGDLLELAFDEDQPDLVRATALFLMEGAGSSETAGATAPLLQDDAPLMRRAAARHQRFAEPRDRAAALASLLQDPTASVRIAAAREMATTPPQALPQSLMQDLRGAMAEWQASLRNTLDSPETHLVLGGMALTMRNPAAAEGAFREVVRMDPQRSDAWVMLIRIANATEGRDAAREVLFEALRYLPADPALRDIAGQL